MAPKKKWTAANWRPIAMTAPAPHPPREPTARISDVVSTYRPTKLFKPSKPETYVTSLDFDDQGELLVSACDDETLQLYNCRDGSHTKTLFSKKYGAHLARFTHQSSSVLYASTKVDDTIRYLSTHDNQYIRYFPGHSAAVTCLALSPGGDEFMSCSLDNTARLWNLNTPNAAGKLILHTPYLAAFDPSATVIAIASPGTSSILLYDLRNYDKAPFATFDMLKIENAYNPKLFSSASRSNASATNNPGRWTTIEFSNDGKSLLLGTASGNGHYLLDAFSGSVTAFCALKKPVSSTADHNSSGNSRPAKSSLRLAPGVRPSTPGSAVQGQGNVSFTPDGRYIFGGAGDQGMYVWDTHQAPGRSSDSNTGSTAQPSSGNGANSKFEDISKLLLHPQHELDFRGPAAVVAFNPRFNLCVSADQEVVFWVPDRVAGGGAPRDGGGGDGEAKGGK